MQLKPIISQGFDDHRAKRLFDIFPELDGQVTVSEVSPHQFSGWHKHNLQYDVFAVVSGSLNIGVIDLDGFGEIIKLKRGESLKIPTGYWHCYTSGEQPATLIYYLSRKHDEDDELRATEAEISSRFGFKMKFPDE